MKRHFIFIIVLFLTMSVRPYGLAAETMQSQQHKNSQPQQEEKETSELSGRLEGGIRIIEVKASRYKFEPDPILVKLGEKVRLIVTSTDVSHGIAISEFKVNVAIPAGKTETVEFVADKKGTFQAYCSVYCGPGHGHMHIDFIVE